MATKISPLQMTDAKAWTGLTTENHLGAIFQQAPQQASNLITQIQQVNFGDNIDSLLAQFPTKEFDDTRAYTWELASQAVDNLPIVEARINGNTVSAGDKPGQFHTTFEVVFGKKWFTDVNRIVGEKNEIYPLQILDEPVQEGTNWVYTVKLDVGDPNAFMPVEELDPGKLFSKEFSPVESTLSKKGGEISFKSNISLRNEFSMIRMQHTAAGNMLSRKLATAIKDGHGKTHKMWTRYEDYKFDYEFRMEKNRLLMFGTSNRRDDGTYPIKGKSGFELKEGAGIREQMEASNTSFYNTFDIDELINRLMDLSEGKVPGDNRNYVLRTGERGAFQFHKALEKYSQLFTPVRDNTRIFKTNDELSRLAYGYGGQFTELEGPNGIRVNVTVDSMYDDRTRNKLGHPDGGVAESYRYDIFDIGTNNDEPNIQLVAPKGQTEIYGYQPGLRHPFSPEGEMSQMSTSTDGYTMHRAFNGGAMVKDPTKTASFIPSVLAS